MMWILACTREKFYSLSMLLPNGIIPRLLTFFVLSFLRLTTISFIHKHLESLIGDINPQLVTCHVLIDCWLQNSFGALLPLHIQLGVSLKYWAWSVSLKVWCYSGLIRETIFVLFLFFLSKRIYTMLVFTNCGSGLTNSNYTELNQLYQQYKDQGLHFDLKMFFHAYRFGNQ